VGNESTMDLGIGIMAPAFGLGTGMGRIHGVLTHLYSRAHEAQQHFEQLCSTPKILLVSCCFLELTSPVLRLLLPRSTL
jgi:hypothetical protein